MKITAAFGPYRAAEQVFSAIRLSLDEARQVIGDLDERLDRLEKALEFYADEDTWRSPAWCATPADRDGGAKARIVLGIPKNDYERKLNVER